MKEVKNNFEIVFESDRIYYTKVSELLVNDYLTMVNDPEIKNKISRKDRTFTYEQELEWIKSKLDNNDLCFSMIEKETGEFIGNIEIVRIVDNIANLGISITRQKQDKHYGTESIKALLKYCYEVLNLDGMDLNVFKNNPRAIHCYENIGFIRDGIGKSDDEIHMKLLK